MKMNEGLYEFLGRLDAAVGNGLENCKIDQLLGPNGCSKCPFGTIICKLRSGKALLREHLNKDYESRKEDD